VSEVPDNTTAAEPKLHKNHVSVILFSFFAGFLGAGIAIGLFISSGAFVSNPQIETKILTRDSEAISEVAGNLKPSVVSINTNVRNGSNGFGFEESAGAGTGLIISEDGLIVTNRHVVPENTSAINIIDSEGKTYDDVAIIDRDTVSDIAFIKIKNGKNLQAAKLGDSSSIKVGDRVIAIGNALGQFSNTVTSGIISGTGRPIIASDGGSSSQSLENLLQTDASINPGNSGGPLVNLAGEVIGINTAVASDAENIGFAIPINEVKPLVSSVEKSNKIIRPFIGVNFVTVTEAVAQMYDLDVNHGALIIGSGSGQSGVLNGSPADAAGLKDGDVITRVGSTPVDQKTSLIAAVNKYSVGDKVSIEFNRDGKTIKKRITLKQRSD